MAFIYKGVNLINGKRYIGRSAQNSLRKRVYGMVADSKNHNRYLANAIRKYGIRMFRFTVLIDGLTEEESLSEERRLIDVLKPEYNVKMGASGQKVKKQNYLSLPKRSSVRDDLFAARPEGEWKSIPGYENLYEIASDGRVWSLPRSKRDCVGHVRWRPGQIIKEGHDPRGRPVVYLSKNAKCRTERVHQLVAAAFIGPRPAGMVVLHGDDVLTNSHKDNLSYGTQHENMRQCKERGRSARGLGHGRAKLTPDAVRIIRELKPTSTYRELAERFGVSHTSIEQVITGKSWSHVK